MSCPLLKEVSYQYEAAALFYAHFDLCCCGFFRSSGINFKSLKAKIQPKCKRRKREHAVLEHLFFAMQQVVAAAFPLGWVCVWKKVKGVREVLFHLERSFFEHRNTNTNQRV